MPCDRRAPVLLFSGNSRLPFDVGLLRALPYWLTGAGLPDRIAETKQALTELLKKAGESGGEDSPIYQLIEGFPDIQRLKTDVFRERVAYEESIKSELSRWAAKGGECGAGNRTKTRTAFGPGIRSAG